MKKILWAAIVLGAFAATPAAANPNCLTVDQIWSWKAVDNKTLIVEDNWHQKFKLTLMISTPDVRYKERIGFKSIGGTALSCLTPGDDVLIHDVAGPGQDPI